MKKCVLFCFTAILLFIADASPGLGQLDPNILWVSDSTLGFFDGFAIHPNGNIIAYHNGFSDFGQIMDTLKVVELDGKTGKFIRKFPVFSSYDDISKLQVSQDGKYIITSYSELNILNYETGLLFRKIPNFSQFTIFPDNNRIIGRYSKFPSTLDSALIMYDIQKDQKIHFRVDYGVTSTAVSPDGKYFATGGRANKNKDGTGQDLTILTLWNAETLKPIKTLGQFDGSNDVSSIKYSPDGKYVGFQVYSSDLYIYNTTDFSLFKHYNKNNIEYGVSGFCFINNNFIAIFGKTRIIRLSDDKQIYSFTPLGSINPIIEYNNFNNTLVEAAYYIYLFDLNKIMTTVKDNIPEEIFSVTYSYGILSLENIQTINNTLGVTILDISGKIIRKLNIPYSNGAVKIPMKLMNGTYILSIKDGEKEYSSKFLVTE
jgi:WD40 repeat protein